MLNTIKSRLGLSTNYIDKNVRESDIACKVEG